MATEADAQEASALGALYRLQSWLSPGYPVGAYTYSHGLEWCVTAAEVHDADSLGTWLEGVLAWGGGYTDAVLLAHARRSAADPAALEDICALARGLAPSSERALETTAQGRAFLDATRGAWPCAEIEALAAIDRQPAYPVVVGVAAAGHGIPESLLLPAYLHAFVSNIISAGVRLIPLGQSAGQRLIAGFAGAVDQQARRAATAPLSDIGSCTIAADIASMHHETQYSRLFRS